MKANEKVCQHCLGLAKKTYYFNGREYCEDCYLTAIEEELNGIADAKAELAGRVEKLQKDTGKAIYFGIDDSEEIYVSKGLDIIGKAIGSKPFKEDYDFGGYRQTVTYGSTEFYTADLGV